MVRDHAGARCKKAVNEGEIVRMDIRIIAVGKIQKNSSEATLLDTYLRRIPWTIDIVEIEAKKARTRLERYGEENQKIRNAIPLGAFVAALDARGRPVGSEKLAAQIAEQHSNGTRVMTFIIGGSDGLDSVTLRCANYTLSFGPNIWPHMLARVMLTEQLYRAHCIQTGHPYHRASGQALAK